LDEYNNQDTPSDGKAGNKTTSDKESNVLRTGLKGTSENTNEGTGLNGALPSDVSSKPPSSSGTEEAFHTISRETSQPT
jgi:hypothetical protein